MTKWPQLDDDRFSSRYAYINVCETFVCVRECVNYLGKAIKTQQSTGYICQFDLQNGAIFEEQKLTDIAMRTDGRRTEWRAGVNGQKKPQMMCFSCFSFFFFVKNQLNLQRVYGIVGTTVEILGQWPFRTEPIQPKGASAFIYVQTMWFMKISHVIRLARWINI